MSDEQSLLSAIVQAKVALQDAECELENCSDVLEARPEWGDYKTAKLARRAAKQHLEAVINHAVETSQGVMDLPVMAEGDDNAMKMFGPRGYMG